MVGGTLSASPIIPHFMTCRMSLKAGKPGNQADSRGLFHICTLAARKAAQTTRKDAGEGHTHVRFDYQLNRHCSKLVAEITKQVKGLITS